MLYAKLLAFRFFLSCFAINDVPFIYYLQQATVLLTEVVCCKSKAVMSRAG